MKKIVVFVCVVTSFCIFVNFAFAQGYTPLVDLPGVTTVGATTNMSAYLSGAIKLLIALGAAFSVLMAIIGGTQYVASGIAPDAENDAKERIQGALVGLALVLSSYLILNSINPNLVAFNLGLPPVGTAPSTAGALVPGDTGVHVFLPQKANPFVQATHVSTTTAISLVPVFASTTLGSLGLSQFINRNNDYSIISHCSGNTTYDLCPKTDLNNDRLFNTADLVFFATKGNSLDVNQNKTLELADSTPGAAKSCFFKISTVNVQTVLPRAIRKIHGEDEPSGVCGGTGNILLPTVACNSATWLKFSVMGGVCAADSGLLSTPFGFVYGANGVSPGVAGSDGQYSNFVNWVNSASSGSAVNLRTLLTKSFFNRQGAGVLTVPYFENTLGKITYTTIAQYDLNDDGIADFGAGGADMAVFNACKGVALLGSCTQADFNMDGVVNERDLGFAKDLFGGPGIALGWKLDWFESRWFDPAGYTDKQIINYCIGHKAFEKCGVADMNGDHLVDGADLAIFNSEATRFDFNGDGVVNLQ